MDPRALRVLLVDDDADDHLLTRQLLADIPQARIELEWVATYHAALEAIAAHRHDAYLLDYRLGEHDGLELLREAIRHGCRAPLILLTGQGDHEVDLAAMKDGAADYLVKGSFDGPMLERSLRYAVERKHAEDALRHARDELEDRVQERTAELAKANEVLRQSEERILASLKEKEVLLQEIHHRVKNNLQLVASLLRLQEATVADSGALRAIRDSHNRVKTMARIHELLYRSLDLAEVDFTEYVNTLAADLFRAHAVDPEAIRLSIHVDAAPLNVNVAIPCGLLINELVSNALQHAFPVNAPPRARPAEVRIELHSVLAEGCALVVADNGIGFPPDLDYRDTSTLGLQLVVTLTEQLGGEIALRREGGTEFTIRFAA